MIGSIFVAFSEKLNFKGFTKKRIFSFLKKSKVNLMQKLIYWTELKIKMGTVKVTQQEHFGFNEKTM